MWGEAKKKLPIFSIILKKNLKKLQETKMTTLRIICMLMYCAFSNWGKEICFVIFTKLTWPRALNCCYIFFNFIIWWKAWSILKVCTYSNLGKHWGVVAHLSHDSIWTSNLWQGHHEAFSTGSWQLARPPLTSPLLGSPLCKLESDLKWWRVGLLYYFFCSLYPGQVSVLWMW